MRIKGTRKQDGKKGEREGRGAEGGRGREGKKERERKEKKGKEKNFNAVKFRVVIPALLHSCVFLCSFYYC